MLPFAPGITGYCTEKDDILYLELRSLRKPQTITFSTQNKTVINTIQQGFSPILEDYLGDSLPGFSDAFMEMQSYSILVNGEEREFSITNNIRMKFCWIPAGKAMLGSPEDEDEAERAISEVESEVEHEFETTGFWMGKYPVTQTQWKEVMGYNPSYFKGDNLPVEQVSCNDCQDFINNCSVSGLKPRLPCSDQWEYACRGGRGNKQPFYWGHALNGDKANCAGNYPYGTNKKGKYLKKTTEVGSYEKAAPHPWGLCDMIGNVWEWCDSSYVYRPCRGGSWCNASRYCRSAHVNATLLHYSFTTGFRLIIF